ncbi:hypothetical protein RIF29_15309 [Crotalaria pallida]|uniref:Uncharacterized protein n=1 Tax=Crotalaria pallida TaxID=3830 RepID=A0AAN9FJW9_CROPI
MGFEYMWQVEVEKMKKKNVVIGCLALVKLSLYIYTHTHTSLNCRLHSRIVSRNIIKGFGMRFGEVEETRLKDKVRVIGTFHYMIVADGSQQQILARVNSS